MVQTAILIALGILLPLAFHTLPNAGSIFLPMHIPVLLCGIICGFPYGMACGIVTPLLSGLFTGMPPAAILPSMACELAAYGAVSSFLIRYVRTGNTYANVYISLIGAMLTGRIFYGVLNALILQSGNYSMNIWVSVAFITAAPGVVIQILLIPPVIFALHKAKFIY